MWASYDDVADRWVGGDLPASETQVTTLVADAEDIILGEFRTIQDRLDAPDDDEAYLPLSTVKRVVANMVIRHLRNPEGFKSAQQVAGPFQRNVTHGGETRSSLVYLTDADRRDLAVPGKANGRAFTVDSTPQPYPAYQPDEYLWEPVT